jgi:hypothetical protein
MTTFNATSTTVGFAATAMAQTTPSTKKPLRWFSYGAQAVKQRHATWPLTKCIHVANAIETELISNGLVLDEQPAQQSTIMRLVIERLAEWIDAKGADYDQRAQAYPTIDSEACSNTHFNQSALRSLLHLQDLKMLNDYITRQKLSG